METTGEPVPAQRTVTTALLPSGPPGAPRAVTHLTDVAARLLTTALQAPVQVQVVPEGALPVDLDGVGVRSVPLRSPTGERFGVLRAAGRDLAWTEADLLLLEDLATTVAAQLELDVHATQHRASQARWDLAMDAAGIGSFEWDLVTGAAAMDERMKALFGFAPDERPTVEAAFGRVHAADRPAVDAAFAQTLRGVADYRTEFRVVRPDGAATWLAARGRALAGADGSAARLVGTVHDVTELRTARDEAARLLETMSTGFLAVDPSWRVTYINSEAAGVVGRPADQLVGHRLWDLSPGLRESEFGRRYEQAVATGKPVRVEAYYAHLQRWYEVRAVPSASGLALYFLDVTGRRADAQRAVEANARLELLAAVSSELADAGLDVEGAVARLAELVVPVLADWCVVSMVSEAGGLRDVGVGHRDPALLPLARTYTAHRLEGRTDLGAVQRARQSQQPVVVASGLTSSVLPTLGCEIARAALAELAPESTVVVPLIARGQMAGVLTLLRGPDRPAASDRELATATEVGARAALALDNARLYAAQRSLAEGLQRSLLTTPPEPDHCQIAVRYVPAAEAASVGGDWFDSFLQADGATVLVIGDVMGHDTVAAAAMGQLRGLLRGIGWHSGAAPAELLAGLDAAMRGLQVDTTASAVVARIEQDAPDSERGVTWLRWSNAGHPPPLVLHPDGTVALLTGDHTDLLLGIDPDGARTEYVVGLDRGSTVLLYTDGLIERRAQDLDEGLALLRTALTELAGVPLERLCDELLSRMLPVVAEDDVALVAVRLHPQDRPRPAEAGPQVVPPGLPADPAG